VVPVRVRVRGHEKRPRVAATTRRTHAEVLTAVTPPMLASTRGKPDDKLLRKALCRWAFNTAQRGDPGRPAEIKEALCGWPATPAAWPT